MAKKKYRDTYDKKLKMNLDKIKKMFANGAIIEDVCKALDISRPTFYRMKEKHPDFKEAVEEGYEMQADKVEGALYKSAIGYKYTERTVKDTPNGTEVIESTKERPGSNTAQIFYLKNIRPDKWNDKKQVEVQGIESFFVGDDD